MSPVKLHNESGLVNLIPIMLIPVRGDLGESFMPEIRTHSLSGGRRQHSIAPPQTQMAHES
jgi:hypothetical protein